MAGEDEKREDAEPSEAAEEEEETRDRRPSSLGSLFSAVEDEATHALSDSEDPRAAPGASS